MMAMMALGMGAGMPGIGTGDGGASGALRTRRRRRLTTRSPTMCRALQTMALESLSWIHTTDAPCYRTFGSAADADDSVRRSIREMLAIRLSFLTTLELTLSPDYHIPGRRTGPPATLDHLWKAFNRVRHAGTVRGLKVTFQPGSGTAELGILDSCPLLDRLEMHLIGMFLDPTTLFVNSRISTRNGFCSISGWSCDLRRLTSNTDTVVYC
ncbi:hypothetical protein BDV98DRAFT_566986 [Pterulicium gracile]|uniref:Uncharacterized protein n=1 Tax=Pterulicium gracile TaxID=1884261 RepID=A0A5C3QPN2_9AGAR|nr:hypothetical protein BDV98DRAFT_566986 [Pterula gracilis]